MKTEARARGIDRISMPTRARPGQAVGSLASFLANARDHGHAPEVAIFDDVGRGERGSVRDHLAPLASEHGSDRFLHADPSDRAAFVERLVAHGLDRRPVELALLGARGLELTTGANRNAMALDAVSSRVLTVDDDTRCRIGSVPGAREGVETRGGDPTEFWFFTDRQHALGSVGATDLDVLAVHGRMLGPSRDDADVRVVATWASYVGDAATSNPMFYLAQHGASLERLLATGSRYERAFENRQLLRGVTVSTISDGSFFTPQVAALDHRALLPPWFPVLRGQGLLFGALLRRLGAGRVAFLPHTIDHVPEPPRTFSRADIEEGAGRMPFASFLRSLMAGTPEAAADRSEARRYASLGHALVAIADEPGELVERVHAIRRAYWAAAIEQLGRTAAKHGARLPAWAEHVRLSIARARIVLETPSASAPLDIPGDDVESGLPRTRALVRGYGELLACWPDIVRSAAELRDEGVTIARPLDAPGR